MDIYVKTAGKRVVEEFEWFLVTADDDRRAAAPPLLIQYEVERLIQDQSFSVVLVRGDENSMLLVGWLRSGRTDSANRNIRNFVAWVGRHGDEPALRAMAALALRGKLDGPVDEAITDDKTKGLCIALEKLEAIADTGLATKVGDAYPDTEAKWGKTSKALQLELARELEDARLPGGKGPLVIVTGIIASEKLADAPGVWRALSTMVKPTDFAPISKKKPKKGFSPTFWAPALLVLALLLITLLLKRLLKD